MEHFEIENPLNYKRDRNSLRRKKAPPTSVTSLPSAPPLPNQPDQLDQPDPEDQTKHISKPNEPTDLTNMPKFLVPNNIFQYFSTMISDSLDHITSLETSVADSGDLPEHWKWTTFFLYSASFVILGCILFYQSFHQSRTTTFITLDKTAGVCIDNHNSDTCCEVPQTVTGTYLLDDFNHWNTESGFNYVHQLYSVGLSGLEYTNVKWAQIMGEIDSQIKEIGLTRGSKRDFSWNLIAWASFTARVYSNTSGTLIFYASGDIGKIFSKPVIQTGYASNVSDEQACSTEIGYSYEQSSRLLTIKTELDTSTTPCTGSAGSFSCQNPCPNILSPQGMGYPSGEAETTYLTWTLDMASISTAIAVNMGIIPLSNLENFKADNNRNLLLDRMVDYKYISSGVMKDTSSYYENLYAPMQPIYCTEYSSLNVSSCFVRIGNMLFYPIINSYGWKGDSEIPNLCIPELINNSAAANYYCNQYNFVVSLIYYPVPDISSSDSNNDSIDFVQSYRNVKKDHNTKRGFKAKKNLNTKKDHIAKKDHDAKKGHKVKKDHNIKKGLNLPSESNDLNNLALTSTDVPNGLNSKNDINVSHNINIKKGLNSSSEFNDLNNFDSLDDLNVTKSFNFQKILNSSNAYAQNEDNAQDYYYFQNDDNAQDDDHVQDDDNTPSEYYNYYYYSYSFEIDDDFAYSISEVIDNGKIFDFAKEVAKLVNKNISNDIWASTQGYNASISTLLGISSQTFFEDFSNLCSNKTNVPEGCAMFSVNFDGGDDRTVSIYDIQPSNYPAFTNTLYNSTVMKYAINNPPTKLIQSYYSCIMKIWDAFFAATGLASSNTQLYIGLGLLAYMYLLVWYQNKIHKAEIRWKSQKLKEEKFRTDSISNLTEALIKDFRSGSMKSGQEVKKLLVELRKGEMELEKERLASFNEIRSFVKEEGWV